MRSLARCILFFALMFGTDSLAIGADVGSIWAGVWHKTDASGAEVDCLDVGLNDDSIHSLAGLTFSVSGPDGFSPYTFDPAKDLDNSLFGVPEMYHEFASLPPGLYTFTLDDCAGHKSKVSDTHVSAPSLPRVDPATIQYQCRSDGTYRFSWAPVNDTHTYYYRLVVLNAATGNAVYYGNRNMASSDVAAWYETARDGSTISHSLLQEGVAYKVRVELHDAPTLGLLTDRSDSAWVNFTPLSSDPPQSIDYAAVYNRFESDGSLTTDLSLGVYNPADIASARVTGPGFSHNFDLTGELDPVYPELYWRTPAALLPGLYTFTVIAKGQQVEQKTYANLTTPVSYPAPDVSTYQAEDLGDGRTRFSWADVKYAGALYYRVYLEEPGTGKYTLSSRTNKTYADLGTSDIAGFSNPHWRVEVYDATSFTLQRNRTVGAFLPLTVQPFDAGKPALFVNLSHVTNYDRQPISDTWTECDNLPCSVHEAGPGGYGRDLSNPGGFVEFMEPITHVPGLYSFTAVGSTGKSTVRYNYVSLPRPIEPVDFRTVHVNQETGGYLSLSWAPVASDIPLWYAVEFYPVALNANGGLDTWYLPGRYYLNNSSVWFTAADLPASPSMFRIFAFDGSDGTTYNNYSRSVTVGYSGPGYDYASLKDEDADGYASNVDADDHDANVKPFPYPTITAFTIPAESNSLTLPITSISVNISKPSGCLTEINNSASCTWTSAKPASYTFLTPGDHTLYAFIRDASGNISASVSVHTTITLPNSVLTLSFIGTGTGSVTGAMSCGKGTSCAPGSFATGSLVALDPVLGSDSLFIGWSGDCQVSGNSCTLTMNGAKSVVANFGIMPAVWMPPAKVPASFFGTLTDAYKAALPGATIKAKVATFSESLLLDRGVAITIKGGYNPGYQSNAGSRSTLHGTLTLRNGSLIAEGLAVR